jgi:hypothetical protein
MCFNATITMTKKIKTKLMPTLYVCVFQCYNYNDKKNQNKTNANTVLLRSSLLVFIQVVLPRCVL